MTYSTWSSDDEGDPRWGEVEEGEEVEEEEEDLVDYSHEQEMELDVREVGHRFTCPLCSDGGGGKDRGQGRMEDGGQGDTEGEERLWSVLNGEGLGQGTPVRRRVVGREEQGLGHRFTCSPCGFKRAEVMQRGGVFRE